MFSGGFARQNEIVQVLLWPKTRKMFYGENGGSVSDVTLGEVLMYLDGDLVPILKNQSLLQT